MPTRRPASAGGRDAGEQGADLVVKADPDKLFFISMLVKDIELVPAVLDLVDNSVDGARALFLERQPEADPKEVPFAGMRVRLAASPEGFEITDNCGGIDLNVARNYAFRFGRPKDYKGVTGSVGEFGVGMKRALFKLGTDFEVLSRSRHTSFELRVDVAAWAAADQPEGAGRSEWTFRLSSAREHLPEPAPADLGTTIRVPTLHNSVKEDFANPLVLGQLREQLRLRHQGAIHQGLEVTLNGERLTGLEPQLLHGRNFNPFNRSFVIREEEGDISVQVIAGIVRAESKTDETRDEGQAEDFRSAGDAGWWIFCNERLLLFRDRTALTGWGESGALYHPQYRRFRGFVYLTAANTNLLPWNTTKTGVDQDSQVWRQVRGVMMTALVQVQGVINRLKIEREGSNGDAPVSAAVSSSRSVPIRDLPNAHDVVVPASPPQRRRAPRTEQKFQFSVDRERYEAVARVMGLANVAEVGRRIFDYFYEREVEE